MAYRARNDGGHHEYECDAEADLATIVNPKQGESALALSEGTTWYHTGSAWAQTVGSPGSGAPADATYLTATSNGTLSAEVVVGATPGGELGGTWATPTVDATHSGSAHVALTANTPTASAEGDTGAVGTGTASAKDDHKHGRESFATPAIVLGTAAAAGVATTPIRSDSTILAFDVTAPTTSAVADAAAVGTATTAARRDHKHGRESFGSPVASAVGDAAGDGTATTDARSDHKHAREAFATPAIVLGSAAAAGSATTPIRSDGTIAAFDTTAPVTQAFADAAAVGTAAFAARRDHKHGMPAAPTTIANDTLWAAKGDLVVATANDTAAVLTVGANGTVPVADSSQTAGVAWELKSAGAQTADVTTSETTSSNTYANLATSGPSVTVTVGKSGMCRVVVSATIKNATSGNSSLMAFQTNGSTPNDVDACGALATVSQVSTRETIVTGLTPGSNTFNAQYHTTSGTVATFVNRRIIAIPL